MTCSPSYAQLSIGSMYEKGQGVPKNEVEAQKWYRKAAEKGFDRAFFNLGCMFFDGEDVKQNYVEAYKWWLLARAKGHEEAAQNILVLERSMTPQQRAEGERMARTGIPRRPPWRFPNLPSRGLRRARIRAR